MHSPTPSAARYRAFPASLPKMPMSVIECRSGAAPPLPMGVTGQSALDADPAAAPIANRVNGQPAMDAHPTAAPIAIGDNGQMATDADPDRHADCKRR